LTIGASEQLISESQIAPVVNTMFDKFQQVAQQLMAMSAKLQQVEHQLAVVENSKSWRITAPLRGIANNLQQSWRFDWEPPKAVLRFGRLLDFGAAEIFS
jgi:hypothetical protein